MQAQDYPASLWAIGLRLQGVSQPDVEAAIASAALVRTWPMRGTLHYVPAEDVRWMLRLLTPRVIARSAGRYRQLELDEATFARARRILSRALRDGRRLTRRQAYSALDAGGVPAAGQRGIHILGHLAQQGLICLGPREAKQPTFVLLDHWVRPAPEPARDEALALLARRYFQGHGPATLHDFAWWSGLLLKEAEAAVAAAGSALRCEAPEGTRWWSSPAASARTARRGRRAVLLPPWDEYVVAYKDRAGVFDAVGHQVDKLPYAVGYWLVVVDGRALGSWRRTRGGPGLRVEVDYWARPTPEQRAAVDKAAAGFVRFSGPGPA